MENYYMAGDLNVVDLDFDDIKTNLKNFLKNQSYFTDYDFEGSALSILLDILAYDTHYKAYLANMVINERFLDTAVKRASVISHSKTLGYVPRSARASKAVVDITVYGVSSNYTMSIDKYTPFTCDINGNSYTFVTHKAHTAIPSGEFNAYTFRNVELYEGNPIAYSYVVDDSNLNRLYKIPALNVDTTTLSVVVQNGSNDLTSYVYSYADFVSVVGSTDRVYYLEEGNDGYYYIYFGDGILGKQIDSGNIINLSYIVTNGEVANTSQMASQVFSLTGTIGGYSASNVIVSLVSASIGGSNKQSTEEIRFLAPKNYSAQGRTITAIDYKALLVKDFPEIDSISVWGGEDNVPPIYGKVFLAIKPKNGYSISSATKDSISAYLKNKSIVSIQFDFVDPDFTFVSVKSNIKFDPTLTTNDSTQIETLASETIQTYFKAKLGQFNTHLYISKLQSIIDTVEKSILGNSITLGLQKRIEPVIGLNSSYTLNFNNPISPYSLYSSAFQIVQGTNTYTVAIKDVPKTTPPDNNGSGVLVLFDITTGNTIVNNIGNVNYATGLVNIVDLSVFGYPVYAIYDVRVNCTPQASIDEISNSIMGDTSESAYIPTPMQNQILMLDDSSGVPGYYVNNGLMVKATPLKG